MYYCTREREGERGEGRGGEEERKGEREGEREGERGRGRYSLYLQVYYTCSTYS